MRKKLGYLFLSLIFLALIYGIYYFNIDRSQKYVLTNEIKEDAISLNFDSTNLYEFISSEHRIKYEFDNNLIKSKTIDNKLVEKYKWLGENKLHIVFDNSGKVIEKYNYKYKNDLLPISLEKGDNTYYFIYNKMKSLRVVIDRYKNIIKIIDYNKNGTILYDSNPKFITRYGYAGGFSDIDSNLLYFREGIYYPKYSRWISKVENTNIISNLVELNHTKEDDIYVCSSTIDKYYHSYICFNKVCRGFYRDDTKLFNANGIFVDNSYYFNHKNCNKLNIDKMKVDISFLKECLNKEMSLENKNKFDLFEYNCHTAANDSIETCLTKSEK